VIARRLLAGLLVLGLQLGCAHVEAAAPRFGDFVFSLPRESASAVPYEPERLTGKVVLVTFISTWCFPCMADLATLRHLQERYGPRGFVNVLVGLDLEGREVLGPFAAMEKLDMPLVIANDRVRAGETPFGPIKELPSRVLFARDGSVVVGYAGVADVQQVLDLVKREVERSP
jgi:thiol-disulfide isomerase/thioredoxin